MQKIGTSEKAQRLKQLVNFPIQEIRPYSLIGIEKKAFCVKRLLATEVMTIPWFTSEICLRNFLNESFSSLKQPLSLRCDPNRVLFSWVRGARHHKREK